MEYTYHYTSPLGGIVMSSDGEFLTGLRFIGQRFFPDSLKAESQNTDLPVFMQTAKWLDIYFDGIIPDFTPPLKMNTSPFRKTVWEIMLEIPHGKTMTYGEIAKIIAKKTGVEKMSAQAVGGAVGHNDFAIIVPCHRVVGSGGNLTGYGGGMDKKIALLTLEKVDMSNFFVPR